MSRKMEDVEGSFVPKKDEKLKKKILRFFDVHEKRERMNFHHLLLRLKNCRNELTRFFFYIKVFFLANYSSILTIIIQFFLFTNIFLMISPVFRSDVFVQTNTRLRFSTYNKRRYQISEVFEMYIIFGSLFFMNQMFIWFQFAKCYFSINRSSALLNDTNGYNIWIVCSNMRCWYFVVILNRICDSVPFHQWHTSVRSCVAPRYHGNFVEQRCSLAR